jgi:hypothetical protein
MPSPNVIQLRQLLAEKFPNLRTRIEPSAAARDRWLTGLAQMDQALDGGLPKGALVEVISAGKTSGSATMLHALIRRAARENKIVTCIDGTDSLEVAEFDPAVLSRLLWIRSGSAAQALKAADLVLRDSNLSFVLIDLGANKEPELRRIPAATWYRFQRLIEGTSTICLVFAPCHTVVAAQIQIILRSRFSLDALEKDAPQLVSALKLEVSDARHGIAHQAQSIA